jgi:hypothetical protein
MFGSFMIHMDSPISLTRLMAGSRAHLLVKRMLKQRPKGQDRSKVMKKDG